MSVPMTNAPADINRIEHALTYIPSDDRETWVTIGMALQSELGDSGLDVWDRWSQTAHNYNERDAMAVWRGFRPDKITIASLFHTAKGFGWVPEKTRATPADIEARKTEAAVNRQISEKERKQAIGTTKIKASEAWALATLAPDNHPYLRKKQIQPHGIGVLGCQYRWLPRSTRNDGNVLVIPMCDLGGAVWSLQFISDHHKRTLAGKQACGLMFRIGAASHDDDPIYLCEGFATGASLYETTGHTVYVAFAAGNLLKAGRILREHYFHKPIWIMADDDWKTEGNPGVTAANKTATEIKGEVIIPDFTGLDRGPKDTDFNDWLRLGGSN